MTLDGESGNVTPISDGIEITAAIEATAPFRAKMLIFNGITRLDLPPDRILEGAMGELEAVVIVGWGKDGDFYAASSVADGGDALWLLELCKKRLLSGS